MSTTVDQRVVEMRFDNQHFEKNVSTTMSTLEKLKQKLNFSGASKGLDNISASAKKIDMSNLGRSAETVGLKFNAMYTMADQALRNITNSVQRTATNMAKALTIDPITTGFQEYETQINATQTILANTASKGSDINDVNKALEELNTYADKTIYNFTEMTRNIGTFTAAGIDLDTSVNAIQGIANLAAVSGSTSQQASTAMYQLSQALAAGKVQLMDWNSVVNAGMGGEMFQNALRETSELLGTGAEEAIRLKGSFRESLREGWLTAEVLTETLKKFTTTGANEYVAEYTGLTKEAVEAEIELAEKTHGEAKAIDEAAKALAKKSGKSEEEIKNMLQFAKNAEDAATKVKTFTQLWDVLKESAQSGWTQTWKLIVGDFEEAKSLLTPLADFLTGIINGFSDTRNAILESALGKSFTGLVDNVKKVIDPIKKSADSVKEVVKSVEEYATVVDEIIGGKWGNGQERWDKLAESGYDWAHAQNLVNEKLGNAKRHATDYAEAQGEVANSQEKTSKATTDYIVELTKKTDAELRAKGYTDDQIKAFRELAEAADKTGIPLNEFVENIDKIDGRYLLINSFKNAGQGLVTVFKSIGQAWREAFHGDASDEDILKKRSDSLFNLIAALHKFSTKLVVSDETADKLTRTFKGLFAAIDIVTTILGGGFKIAFKIISQILSYFGTDILSVTASIGDAIVGFRDWFDSLFDISGVLDVVVPVIKIFVKTISGLFTAIKNSEQFQNLINFFEDIFHSLSRTIEQAGGIKQILSDFFSSIFEPLTKISGVEDFIDGIKGVFNTLSKIDFSAPDALLTIVESIQSAFSNLKDIDLKEVGTFIFDGLILGLFDGAKKVVTTILTVAQELIDRFCDILGINSPSKVFMAIGGFIIAGLIAGIKEGLISVPDALQGIVDKCIGIFQAIDWGTIMAFGVSVAGLMFIKKIGDVLENFSAPFAGVGEILEQVSGVVKSFGKLTKAAAFNIRMKGIKQLAIAIAIISGSIIALVHFGGDDYTKMWNAVGMIVVLAVVLAGLSIAMNKLSDSSVDIENGKFSLSGLKTGLLVMAAAIAIIAGVTYLLGRMDPDAAKNGFDRLILVMASMLGFVKICEVITKGNISENITKIGSLMIKLGIAMGLMVGVCKLIDLLEPREMVKAGIFALAFGIFVFAITSVAKSSGNNVGKVGGMMIKLAIAMGLMVGICKLIDLLKPAEIIKGGIFALAFLEFVKALVNITKIGKKQQIAKLGGLLLSISISMLLMVGVCKLVGKLSIWDMLKGAAFIAGFTVFVGALVSVTKIGNEQTIAKVSGTILAISIAVGILAAVCMMLSLLDLGDLAKGVIAVRILGSIMALMIKSLKGAQNVKGSLIAMTIAIALLSVAVAGLSFIDPVKLYSAVGAISIVLGMFALLIRSTKGVNGSIGPLIVMTTAIGLIAGMLWLLSSVTDSAQDNIKNATALSILMIAMADVMKTISGMQTDLKNALKTVVGLAALAAPMVLFALSLSLMNNVDNAMTNVVAISGLMLAMTGVLAAISAIGKYLSGGIIPGILGLTAMVIPMAAFVGILSWMNNIENATSNATALTKLMTVMTLLLVPLSIIGAIAASGVGAAFIIAGIASLLAMVIPMAAFVGILSWMSNIENATANASLLIGLMTVMTGLLTHLAIIGPFALVGVSALAGLTILIGAIAGLVIALGGLNELTDGGLEKIIDSGIPLLIKLAEGIGTMVGKFVGCMGEAIADSLVSIGEDIVSLMKSLKTASEYADGIEASSFDGVKEFLDVLGDIGLTMVGTSFADIFTLGGTSIEKFETDGVAFFGALKAISSEMTGFALPDNFSSESVMTLLDMMRSVSSKMMGNSWAEAFTLGGSSMEKFKTDAKAFFGAIKEISTEMTGLTFPEDFSTEGITTLLDTLKAVSSRMLGNSWKEAFTFGEGTSIEQFKTDAIAFFQAIKAIIPEMTGFTFPEDFSIEGVTTLLDTLKTVSTRMLGISWAEAFTLGEGTSIEQFKTDAIAFFQAIKAIAPEMTGLTFPEDFSIEGVTTLLDALKTVGKSMMGVSWADLFTVGEGNSMEQLKTYGVGLFSAIKAISAEATGVTTESFSVGITAIDKIKEVFASLKGIDYSGVEEFTGIGTGGIGADGPMHDVGVAIKDFATQVSGIDTAVLSTSITAANKIRTFIGNLVGLDASGIENFKAKAVGTALNGYISKVSDMDTSVVSSSISCANRLKNFIASLVDLDSSGVGNFKLKTIGDSLKSYSASVAGIDVALVSSSISAANRLKNFISSLAGLDTSGVGSFKSAVSSLGQINIESFIKAFTGSTAKLASAGSNMMNSLIKGIQSKRSALVNIAKSSVDASANVIKSRANTFRTAGVQLMTKFVQGVNSQKSKAKNAMTSFIKTVITAIRGYYSNFYSAGSYLVDGFAAGITANTFKAQAKAVAMAKAALKAAEEALGIASPSKEFYKVGDYAGQGFVNALTDYDRNSYKAGSEMANSARLGLSSAISTIADIINGDMDMQPTIRPVLDLSEVSSGAGAISGMFDMNPSVGVMANVRAINSMMNRNQNGTNADVVSAINKLRSDLGNLGGDTYQINGITYGAGSEVSDAIQTLVRAAIVERRV